MADREHPVRVVRRTRNLSQGELAKRAGISRQALGAIEAATYQPNVSVALAIARELGATVEALFGAGRDEVRHMRARWGSDAGAPPTGKHPRVALGRVGGKLIAHPQPPVQLALAPAAGMIEHASRGAAEVASFRTDEEIEAALLIAGCDPAAALLTEWLARRRSPVSPVVISCSSGKALHELLDGRAHIAGAHLRDPKSGEFNCGAAVRGLKRHPAVLVNFARWELGIATAPGNPLKLRGFEDLSRSGLRIANRELGSGARAALDEAIGALNLRSAGIEGYQREFAGHLEVASAIATGQADFGVTIRVAADVYGLGFVPIREERYDLVILKRDLDAPAVKALLEALNSGSLAREVAQFCGYDTSQMGAILAHLN
ncbi:MAG TPA: substrate-binding domain-containing protein [Candidatus Binataceae bacterium]|nr:substrate-binding domain-containing protein [Candidatus Binataceae bacterium]